MKQHKHEMGYKPDSVKPEEFYDGPSRSAMKREAQAKTDVVNDLLALSKAQLKKFSCFDEAFLESLALMQRMPFGPAYRRQRNFLGKRIRDEDWFDEIAHTLSIVTGTNKQATAIHHRCEQWRDRLMTQGDEALTALISEFPEADRQQLRNTVRMAKQEQEQNKPPKQFRLLFQQIRALHEPQLAFVATDDEENEDND